MLWEILKASKGILVADFYADLWANIAGGGTPVDVFVEMIGSLPLYYNGKGYDLTDYLISGNTIQDGTPSPDAPVDAIGSGVRTGNLINPTDMIDKHFVNQEGVIVEYPKRTTTPIIAVNGAYMVLSYSTNLDSVYAIYALFSNGTMIDRKTSIVSGTVIDVSQADSICVSFYSYNSQVYVQSAELQIQLAYGSTPLPYEPYGFKLPLTVNSTEYPIYLGTVPTTRRIKKLVLTGEETWGKDANFDQLDDYFYTDPISGLMRTSSAISSHFISGSRGVANSIWIGGNASTPRIVVEISKLYTGITSADDKEARVAKFKSYLAQQYASGTPVTVWYVLAEPETGIVNEPLMKIGDYADTVSAAQAGVTIPTENGENILGITSIVKPSEVYVKGKGIKPTGYGQLADVNGVNILDKDGRPICVHGQ